MQDSEEINCVRLLGNNADMDSPPQQNTRNKIECQKPSSLEAKGDFFEKANNSLLAKVTFSEQSVRRKRSYKVLYDKDWSDDIKESHINYHTEQAVVPVRVGETIFMVDARGSNESDPKTIGWLKAEVVQLFCEQFYNNNNFSGMKPIVQHIVYGGNILESTHLVKDILAALDPGDITDAVITGWIPITLAERYLVFCKQCDRSPNPKLLNKLYNMKFPDDVVVASDCELDRWSVLPLLKAIGEDWILSVLDLSHNELDSLVGYDIQEMITTSKRMDLGLTLDLHNNQLQSACLLKISRCPISLSRLKALNLSGNPLTNGCGHILAKIIKECKALAILNLQNCSLTGVTFRNIAEALPLESGLVKLSIGKNNYIAGNTMAKLLKKLSMLKNFSELDITDVSLDMTSLESLCDLLQSSSLSTLAIGGTEIGLFGALELSESLATRRTTLTMLDMSFCDVDPREGSKLCQDLILHGLVQLNLSGNRLEERGANVLRHLLARSCCHLKILMINKCALGKIGILKIIQALSDNNSLQDLGLAGNYITDKNSFFNVVTGADTCSVESCVKGAVSKLNFHVECSDNNVDDWPKQHESPTSDECTSFLHCVSDKKYNNGVKDQGCQSLPTCLKTHPSETKACVGNKSDNTREKTLSLFCKQCERRCDDYIVDGEEVGSSDGVNCSSLKNDCASSSQPFGLTMYKSCLLPDLHTHENIVIKGDVNTTKISCGGYASELFIVIQMAKNLQLLDLSDNSLPLDMAEQLYVAWSLNTRAANPVKHIDKPVVHFSVEGRQCCGQRLCCQKWI